ncbi:hypothetical protein Ancab_014903 [Ancistrocladus abbreviatus]
MEAQEGNSSDIRQPEIEVGSANASNTSNFIEDFNDVPSNQGDFDHFAIDPIVCSSKKVRSKVWGHLIKICAENLKDQRAKCKYCGAILGADPAKGMTCLKNHIVRWSSKQEFGFPCLEIEDCDGLSIMAAALLKCPRTPPSMVSKLRIIQWYETEMYPSGEFAFVVFSLANCRLGVLPLELNKLLIIVVVLSMALTPALNELGRRASDFIDDKFDMDAKAAENLNFDASEVVVILGFGQMGQVLANFLSAPLASGGDGDGVGWPYIAFDLNPAVVKVRVGDLVRFCSKSTAAPEDNLSEPNHTKQEPEIPESKDTEEQVVLHCEMGKDNSSKEKSEEAQESDSLPINYS